ncbi:MAG TPA: hypothetical protein VL325_03150 [Pyrinomonadaceae bacterium]|nr:hypothetical protein [Pyrinomonadaceae bacterium]
MITGFNTDIEHDGITYHVQTEDKGVATPVILSLVYNRGTILASKRSPYDDLIGDELDENVLAERLQRQHKLMCAAVRAGRIEDLKKMTEANRRSSANAEPKKAKKDKKADEKVVEDEPKNGPDPLAVTEPPADDAELDAPIPMPAAGVSLIDEFVTPVQFFANFDSVNAEEILPVEAVEIMSDLAGESRPEHNNLNAEILGDSKFKGGDQKTVCIMVSRGSAHKVIQGAEILAKVIGSEFKPRISHIKTDQNGIANIKVKVPSFQSGRAELVISVRNEAEEIELRRDVAKA